MSGSLEILLAELGISSGDLQERGLLPCPEVKDLVPVQIDLDGRRHELIKEAADAWHAMRAAAEKDGIELNIVSAFRSVERQAEIIRRKLVHGVQLCDILAVSAAPGYSEHHTGRAVDIATPDSPVLAPEFENTKAFQWLIENADSFYFHLSYPRGNQYGYLHEPWHWCYKMPGSQLETDATRRFT